MRSTVETIRTVAKIAIGTSLILLSACHAVGAERGNSSETQRDLGLIANVMQQVEKSYVRPANDQRLTTNALKGMLTRLDPHSDYMDSKEFQEFSADTRGRFGGLGMELTEDDGLPKVISPIDGTPAARAGIQPGDLITEIDGRATDGMGLMKVVEILRGKPGTRVTLTIARNHRAPFRAALTRAVINVASVKSTLEPGDIGYVRITMFAENTASELRQAIGKLMRDAGGRLSGFILDLRDDPGGMLTSAVAVAGDFLDGGTVVSTRGRMSDDDHVYAAPANGDMIRGTPLAVLVNSASASASEIVAGALQDRHRAVIMGTPSFGKGSVQTILPIEGGGALRLTTALYYTPSGRSIQGRGIIPNIEVEVPPDEQVADAVITRESDLHGSLKNTTSSAQPALLQAAATGADRPIKPMIIGTAKDAQLAAALAQLRTGNSANFTMHSGHGAQRSDSSRS